MSWAGSADSLFQYAARQVDAIASPCKITTVTLSIKRDNYKPVQDYCEIIDERLLSDKFPSLRIVRLYKESYEEVPHDCFPSLKKRGLLEGVGWPEAFL